MMQLITCQECGSSGSLVEVKVSFIGMNAPICPHCGKNTDEWHIESKNFYLCSLECISKMIKRGNVKCWSCTDIRGEPTGYGLSCVGKPKKKCDICKGKKYVVLPNLKRVKEKPPKITGVMGEPACDCNNKPLIDPVWGKDSSTFTKMER